MTINPKSLAILSMLAVVVGIVFWPTLYRYDRFGSGEGSIPMRTNRVTGRSQLFDGIEWRGQPSQTSTTPPTDTLRTLDPLERLHVTGRATMDQVGYFSAEIYNGSRCSVVTLYITVIPLDSRGRTEYARSFRKDVRIAPLTTDNVLIHTGSAGAVARTSWTIDSVVGRCPRMTTAAADSFDPVNLNPFPVTTH